MVQTKTNNDNYIKIELECYTESSKDEIFALVGNYRTSGSRVGNKVTAWDYQCGKCDRALDTLTSICERCNND